ncbi:MAG: TIR domain-containing protein, partial [Bacteroidota bacterium]
MFKVFLSHNSEDKPQVEVLAHLLRQESGVEPWLDAWNLIPGEPWQEAIEEALEDCAVCLCLIGRGDFGPWQHAEMRAAIAKRIQAKDRQFRVIPVLLPGASRGDRSKLPSFLVQTTWVEFRKSFEEEQNYHRLLSGIRGKAPGPGPSAAISLAAEDCPYPGLRFFDVDQAHLFFGRASVVEWLHRKLDPDSSSQLAFRFLAIMGPSGSGKSSLARAGLLASLKGGALVGSEAWPQVICFPGERPLENLALALSKAGIVAKGARAIQDFEAAMRQSPKALYLQGRLQP